MFMDCEPYPGPAEGDSLPNWEDMAKTLERDMRLSLYGIQGPAYNAGSVFKISTA